MKPSLENLLEKLLSAPESDKISLIRFILRSLKESCSVYARYSDVAEYNDYAKKIKSILSKLLSDSARENEGSTIEDEEWENEFVESGADIGAWEEDEETFVSTEPKILIPEDDLNTPDARLKRQIAVWNGKADEWMKLPDLDASKPEKIVKFIKSAFAFYCDLNCNSFEGQGKLIESFTELWSSVSNDLKEMGYEITPVNFEALQEPLGDKIYTCRSRNTGIEMELIRPGIRNKDEEILKPATLISLPMDSPYAEDHPNASLAPHWRGIFGELEALTIYLDIQKNCFSAIEGINKNNIELLEQCSTAVISEINRRYEVLKSTLEKDDETIYRVATDYWRVEECFWSIFHQDDRPSGVSYLDKIRNRIQGWRTILRRAMKFHIRDFSCGSDSLASINKYIGNIIIKTQKDVAPGTVIKELRPAIMVKVQSVNRLLKGRVIST